MNIKKPVQIRVLAEPEDIEQVVQHILCGFLGVSVATTHSKQYLPSHKYKGRSSQVRVYITIARKKDDIRHRTGFEYVNFDGGVLAVGVEDVTDRQPRRRRSR